MCTYVDGIIYTTIWLYGCFMLLVGGGLVQIMCVFSHHMYIWIYTVIYVFWIDQWLWLIVVAAWWCFLGGDVYKSKTIQKCFVDRWISGDPFTTDHDLFGGLKSFSFGVWLMIDWVIEGYWYMLYLKNAIPPFSNTLTYKKLKTLPIHG